MKKFLVSLLFLLLTMPFSLAAAAGHIQDAAAVAGVSGGGQQLTAVVLEYDAVIRNASLQPADFAVTGAEISRVYANTEAAQAAAGRDGRYVILELAVKPISRVMGHDPASGEHKAAPAGAMQGPQLGAPAGEPHVAKLFTAEAAQVKAIRTAAGAVYEGTASLRTTHMLQPVVDEFQTAVFTDAARGQAQLMYNLYVPEGYDPAKKYPLVLFIHDAGVVGDNPRETLTQGLGAVVWAEPEEQAKHPCFVLAPQYTRVIADDNSQTTADMDVTIDLLRDLMKRYSIDANRLYDTGQSMGGMTSIAMDIKYPDVFAASLLVACQWKPELTAPLAAMPLWIVVSAGDTKAHPGMDAITQVLRQHGATVSEGLWQAEANPEVLAEEVRTMRRRHASVNYTVFQGGNHPYTWQYAYSIAGIRDWLFEQTKKN